MFICSTGVVWMCVKMQCSNNNITAAVVTDTRRRQADKIQEKPSHPPPNYPPVYRVIIISIKKAYLLETFFRLARVVGMMIPSSSFGKFLSLWKSQRYKGGFGFFATAFICMSDISMMIVKLVVILPCKIISLLDFITYSIFFLGIGITFPQRRCWEGVVQLHRWLQGLRWGRDWSAVFSWDLGLLTWILW